MAAESDIFPPFDWVISHQDGIATFEATGEDFDVFKATLADNDTLTLTGGLFQSALLLVENTSALIEKDKLDPLLELEKTFQKKGGIKLRFTAARWKISFTLFLPPVESSEVDVLMKKVQRLEQKMRAIESRHMGVAYDAVSTSTCKNGAVVQWDKCLITDESCITHQVAGPTVEKAGTYQIIVSLVGVSNQNGKYTSVMVQDKEVARGYISDNANYQRQSHVICACEISAGEQVSVITRFSGNMLASEFANRLTLINFSN